jgi:hypothetical protein
VFILNALRQTLSPLESARTKKGRGGPGAQTSVCAPACQHIHAHSNPRNPKSLIRLLHTSLDTRGWEVNKKARKLAPAGLFNSV